MDDRTGGPIRVLHVDDEPDFAAVVGTRLAEIDDRFAVETATGADEALARLAERPPDCVVSDYEMPGRDGLDLLRAVRERHPDLPFVLFTGRGSEAVASEAISAGVTDYLQKGTGTERYELLANRIDNAVTARRDARRVRRQEELLGLTEFAGDTGGWELDLETGAFRPTDGARRLAGLADGASPSHERWLDRYHPADRPAVRAALDRVAETGERTRGVWRLRTADGDERLVELTVTPVAPDGEVERLHGAIDDVTERRRRERELERLRTEYRTLIENLPNGGVFLFDEDLVYRHAGGAELAAVGLSPADFEGATPGEVFPDEIAAELRRHYRAALGGEERSFEQELAGRRYRTHVVPVRADGEVVSGVAVSQNVTERARRERELERQNERLEEFAGVVSHDLRGPLAVVRGRVALARRADDGGDDHLAAAEAALDRADALVEDVLALARESDRVEGTEPTSLADATRRAWESVPTAGARLVVDADATVEADRRRLGRILENLLGNAVEHGATGGQPTSDDADGATADRTGADDTTGADDEPTATVRVGPLADGRDGFYVADDGPGVPADDRERVFEAGYTTAADGTGFGLRIVAEAARAHGWTVAVAESESGGARIEIAGVDGG